MTGLLLRRLLEAVLVFFGVTLVSYLSSGWPSAYVLPAVVVATPRRTSSASTRWW